MGAELAKRREKRNSGLTDDEIKILRERTHYSKKIIVALHKIHLYDFPSGTMDEKAFVEFYEKSHPGGQNQDIIRRAFKEMDLNKNGVIEFDEMLLTLVGIKNPSNSTNPDSESNLSRRLGIVFDLWNKSEDGKMNQDELKFMISVAYDLNNEKDRTGDNSPEKRAADILSKLDISKDQRLSRHEFIDGLKNDTHIRKMLEPIIMFQ